MEKIWQSFESWICDIPQDAYTKKGIAANAYQQGWHTAQHRMHLTAFGVGMLAFCAGFGVCWLVFVR